MITKDTIKSLETLDMVLNGNLIRLINIIESLFEFFDHFEQDPFENGNTAFGADEGSVRGWGHLGELREKYDRIIEDLTRK